MSRTVQELATLETEMHEHEVVLGLNEHGYYQHFKSRSLELNQPVCDNIYQERNNILKTVYRRQALQYHPDKNRNLNQVQKDEKEEKFKKISVANTALADYLQTMAEERQQQIVENLAAIADEKRGKSVVAFNIKNRLDLVRLSSNESLADATRKLSTAYGDNHYRVELSDQNLEILIAKVSSSFDLKEVLSVLSPIDCYIVYKKLIESNADVPFIATALDIRLHLEYLPRTLKSDFIDRCVRQNKIMPVIRKHQDLKHILAHLEILSIAMCRVFENMIDQRIDSYRFCSDLSQLQYLLPLCPRQLRSQIFNKVSKIILPNLTWRELYALANQCLELESPDSLNTILHHVLADTNLALIIQRSPEVDADIIEDLCELIGLITEFGHADYTTAPILNNSVYLHKILLLLLSRPMHDSLQTKIIDSYWQGVCAFIDIDMNYFNKLIQLLSPGAMLYFINNLDQNFIVNITTEKGAMVSFLNGIAPKLYHEDDDSDKIKTLVGEQHLIECLDRDIETPADLLTLNLKVRGEIIGLMSNYFSGKLQEYIAGRQGRTSFGALFTYTGADKVAAAAKLMNCMNNPEDGFDSLETKDMKILNNGTLGTDYVNKIKCFFDIDEHLIHRSNSQNNPARRN